MKRAVWIVFVLCAALFGADKKAPQGHGEDEAVAITATIVSPDRLRDDVGSDFNSNYTVLDVQITPKGGKPYAVHLDDFTLRDESNGEHSGPFQYAAQVAGAGALEVQQTYGNRANADSPRPLEGTKLTMKDNAKGDPALDTLKKRMLAETTTAEPVSGLLFFPLTKAKARNLILSCKTPASHLRLNFR